MTACPWPIFFFCYLITGIAQLGYRYRSGIYLIYFYSNAL